jgi:hypothetical protein
MWRGGVEGRILLLLHFQFFGIGCRKIYDALINTP